jgi:hypothetical protein
MNRMSSNPSITCVLDTARLSYHMIERPNDDHIQLFLDSLEKQSFQNFEVIIADCIHNCRETTAQNNTYKDKHYSFNIIHFQVKSPWLDKGLWTGQAGWNQAALLAKGELFLTFGDCCEPPPHYLEKIWNWYLKGYWCMGLVIYKKGNKLLVKDELKAMTIVRDSRWPFVEKHGWDFIEDVDGGKLLKGKSGAQQFHGYSCLPLEVLLKLNGFDENMDGDKALGDQDMGMRLWMAGYDNVLFLDPEVYIYENAHYSIPKEILWCEGPSIRSNYSLMELNRMKGRWRTNSYRLSQEEVEWMLEHGRQWGFPDKEAVRNNPNFQWWLNNQPIFNLSELRWQVQEKLEEEVVEIPKYYS